MPFSAAAKISLASASPGKLGGFAAMGFKWAFEYSSFFFSVLRRERRRGEIHNEILEVSRPLQMAAVARNCAE
jgi:hypothetical protein